MEGVVCLVISLQKVCGFVKYCEETKFFKTGFLAEVRFFHSESTRPGLYGQRAA